MRDIFGFSLISLPGKYDISLIQISNYISQQQTLKIRTSEMEVMSTFVAIEENQLLFLRNVPLLVICE